MTFDATTNAADIAKRFNRRIAKLEAAIKNGLRKWAITVDNAQVANLSGGSATGDYPLPVRTGNLLQGHFFKVQRHYVALVGNKTSYALPVHEGRGSNIVHGRRPFLEDAAQSVDGGDIMRTEMRKAVFAL
jgi:hypothetical protein